MLLELAISDFAIIERCTVRFGTGFIAMTGETGAGKSIIVDALTAALGGRVGPEMVRAGARGASVEAVFALDTLSESGRQALMDHELNAEDDTLILRRDINPAGRGVSRVNGRAVPAAVLQALSANLVDIHGQSEHLSLLRPDRQLEMLDRYAGLRDLRARFSDEARALAHARRSLADLTSGQREAERRLDLLRFQLDEIQQAELRVGEEEEWMVERQRLGNAERLTELSGTALDQLNGGAADTGSDTVGAVELVAMANRALTELARIDPAAEAMRDLSSTILYEAEDLASALRRYRDNVEYDPDRLTQIEHRLDILTRLKRKYGDTIEDVLTYCASAQTELEMIERFDERLEELNRAVVAAEQTAAADARALSEARREHAQHFTTRVLAQLGQLGLGNTRFEVQLDQAWTADGLEVTLEGETGRYAYSTTGIDRIAFMVSFNPGEPLRPIEKVASGGETARFMLALKTVLSTADDVVTLVFDEIDTGVGGRSGQIVGKMLRDLAGSHQVISITHLPQIAAQATQHFKIVKTQGIDRTGVQVEDLEAQDRVDELAEMLAGAHPTEAARRNAQELLTLAG